MNIVLNGNPRELPDGSTVKQLLNEMKLDSEQVAVEVNLEVIRRIRHAEHRLADGDTVEVVTFVGGG